MLKTTLARLLFALLIGSPVLALVPIVAEAATSSSAQATASIDADSLLADSGSKPYLSGTTTAAKIRIMVTASSTSKTLFKSSSKSVHGSDWRIHVTKKLPDGTYTVSVYQDVKGKLTLLTQGTLSVGIPPVTLTVAPIALLAGGVASAGTIVPISYLQVINQSDATTTIAGFWIQENGNASTNAIVGLSSVDDKGNNRVGTVVVEGKTPFLGNKAYVPSGAVIGPHQMKLFTIKAQLGLGAAAYAGTNLMLDVAGVDAPVSFNATFPIRGTTWVISR